MLTVVSRSTFTGHARSAGEGQACTGQGANSRRTGSGRAAAFAARSLRDHLTKRNLKHDKTRKTMRPFSPDLTMPESCLVIYDDAPASVPQITLPRDLRPLGDSNGSTSFTPCRGSNVWSYWTERAKLSSKIPPCVETSGEFDQFYCARAGRVARRATYSFFRSALSTEQERASRVRRNKIALTLQNKTD
jgi:hypothetical protein